MHTGFAFDRPAEVPVTPAPSAETLRLMRQVVAPELAEVYPQFAAKVFGFGRAGLKHHLQAAFAAWSLCGPVPTPKSRRTQRNSVKQVEAAVIGTGWCGGIRAETLSRSALVDKLHICEIRPDRLAEVKALTKPATATLDYQDIVRNDNISVVYISTTPESNHYPIARDCLRAGKNVLLEKPISLELWEADELITARQAQQSEIHHRLFAALQHQESPSPRRRSTTARSARSCPCW